jgi:hypothetical protein
MEKPKAKAWSVERLRQLIEEASANSSTVYLIQYVNHMLYYFFYGLSFKLFIPACRLCHTTFKKR